MYIMNKKMRIFVLSIQNVTVNQPDFTITLSLEYDNVYER